MIINVTLIMTVSTELLTLSLLKEGGFKSNSFKVEEVSLPYLDSEVVPLPLVTLNNGCVTEMTWVCGLPSLCVNVFAAVCEVLDQSKHPRLPGRKNRNGTSHWVR